MNCINCVFLRGVVDEAPTYGYSAYGEIFYRLNLNIARLSGARDTVHIVISERLYPMRYISVGDVLEVRGEYRSKNKDENGARRLILYVFAAEVQLCVHELTPENQIELRGYLCRPANRRKTPFGREIADIILAVNRRYGRSDYIPCIAWGRYAAFAQTLRVGAGLSVVGRIQSREYIKSQNGSEIKKIAFEVSASSMEIDDN